MHNANQQSASETNASDDAKGKANSLVTQENAPLVLAALFKKSKTKSKKPNIKHPLNAKKEAPWHSFTEEDATGFQWQKRGPESFKIRRRAPDGSWIVRQKGLKTYEDALRTACTINAQLGIIEGKKKLSVYQDELKAEKIPTIEEAIILWEHDMTGRVEPSTVRSNVNAIKHLCKFLGVVAFVDFSKSKLKRFVKRYLSKNHSAYGYSVVSKLQNLTKYCMGEDYAIPNAGSILAFKIENWVHRPHRYLEEHEMARIIEVFQLPNEADSLPPGSWTGDGRRSQELKRRMSATVEWQTRNAMLPMIWVMHRYGNRPKELCELKVGDWDKKTSLLTIRSVTRKTRKSEKRMVLRKIPVDPDTAEILTTCAGNRFSEEPLFRRYRRLNESFGKWTSAWFCRKYARIARKYGVDTTIYDIRHTVATILYYHYVIKEGKGPEMIKVILGHAEGSQEWKKYVHFLENRAASFDLAIDYTRSPKFYLNSIANISIPKVKS